LGCYGAGGVNKLIGHRFFCKNVATSFAINQGLANLQKVRHPVNKFAEIVAATVLYGELSLGTAIVAEEWVSSHDQYGRNRP